MSGETQKPRTEAGRVALDLYYPHFDGVIGEFSRQRFIEVILAIEADAARAAADSVKESWLAAALLTRDEQDGAAAGLREAAIDLLGEVGFMRSCLSKGHKLSPADFARQDKAMERAVFILAPEAIAEEVAQLIHRPIRTGPTYGHPPTVPEDLR